MAWTPYLLLGIAIARQPIPNFVCQGGHSLGSWSASVMATVAGIACKRLVISAGFSSLPAVSWLCSLLGFGHIAPASMLPLLHPSTQVEFCHAVDDTLFPLHHLEALAAKAPHCHVTKTRGSHNSSFTFEEAAKKIAKPF